MNNKYLSLLAKSYPTKESIIREIINLKAIQRLPKGTEYFVSDLHGEFNAFQHILRNGSGSVKEKIKEVFKEQLTCYEQNELASLIYYPEETLNHLNTELNKEWFEVTIDQLIELTKHSGRKYTRSKVRKALPQRYAYIIEELLYQIKDNDNKTDYHNQIILDIIQLGQSDSLITDLCYTIQELVVDHLHVVGDIYDRGPEPDNIMEALINYHSVDIQWGNHDVIWIGAAAGSPICIMAIIRICARYNNLDIIEDTYGINLRSLSTYANQHYTENKAFIPKTETSKDSKKQDLLEITNIHQASAILQFKLEEQLITRRPEFKMEHRQLLNKIDYNTSSISIKGTHYSLTNTCFKTIDPVNPSKLTQEEKVIIDKLVHNFIHSEKLQRHIDFLMKKGSMYLIYNNNLLLHGCIPLNEDGSLKTFTIQNQQLKGRELLDFFEDNLRSAYKNKKEREDFATDLIWYLWSGELSSLFGKKEMTTFERYFIQDTTTHLEEKNPYYAKREDKQIIQSILKEFGLSSEHSHLINGHTPVKEIKGESPIKAEGKMLVIDGGFSKPYQKTTGLAGYTLLYNSYGMQLVAHKPFSSVHDVIIQHDDIISIKRLVDQPTKRQLVKDTTIGQQLQESINDLTNLLNFLT